MSIRTRSLLAKCSFGRALVPVLAISIAGACASADGDVVITEAGSTVLEWNAAAVETFGSYDDPHLSQRTYALLSVAQLGALEESERASSEGPTSRSVAVATASAAVLSALHPDRTSLLDAMLEEYRERAREGEGAEALERGTQIGAAAAEQVLAYAAADGADQAWAGELPGVEWAWKSAADEEPIGQSWSLVRPWVLSRIDEIRPVHPEFGSPEFTAALEEVVQVVNDLTPEQIEIARRWMNPIDGYWNEVAAEQIREQGISEVEAARILTTLNVAMLDAAAACFDAKYHYWFPRPSHADPSISMAVDLPNHPSFPSGHSCSSGAAATVLSHFFPGAAGRINETADEIAVSRLYAGVHYRFDNDTGLEIGNEVGRRAVAMELSANGLLAREGRLLAGE